MRDFWPYITPAKYFDDICLTELPLSGQNLDPFLENKVIKKCLLQTMWNEKKTIERFERSLKKKIDFESPIFAIFDYFVKVQLSRYKKIFCRSDLGSKISCVCCAARNFSL